MPWASGEETGQPRAGIPSEPNPAIVDKKKIESIKINSRATGIAEDVDRIAYSFPLFREGLNNKIRNRSPLKLDVSLGLHSIVNF
jgi:hypothetical protein